MDVRSTLQDLLIFKSRFHFENRVQLTASFLLAAMTDFFSFCFYVWVCSAAWFFCFSFNACPADLIGTSGTIKSSANVCIFQKEQKRRPHCGLSANPVADLGP